MYLEDACNIKRTDDGKFVVSVHHKPKKKKGKMGDAPMQMEEPKSYVANDMEELVGIIREYLGGEKTENEKYEKGYKSA